MLCRRMRKIDSPGPIITHLACPGKLAIGYGRTHERTRILIVQYSLHRMLFLAKRTDRRTDGWAFRCFAFSGFLISLERENAYKSADQISSKYDFVV